MLKTVVASLFLCCALLFIPSTADAGCRCGRSHISDKKRCHKCPCSCSVCTNPNCARDMPDALRMFPGATEAWCDFKTSLDTPEGAKTAERVPLDG